MKSNLGKRILSTIIGVPAVVLLITLFPYYHYIGFSLLTICATVLGSFEMSKILFGKVVSVAFLPVLLPIAQYFQNLFNLNPFLTDLLFILILFFLFALEIKRGEADEFQESLIRTSKESLLILYPGYLLTFIIRILAMGDNAGISLVYFFLLVFSNDVFAYVFGMLFGRKSQKVFLVSPKKSIAGFVGGFLSCIGLSVGFFYCYGNKFSQMTLLRSIILGAAISCSANIGDLIESVFKRSAGIKDSGNVVPGRGGALDCIDSIISSAPIFFIIMRFGL